MERSRKIYKVTLVGGAVNVVLLVFKFVAGILGHSAAMVADAVHSLSDFVTDIIVLVFVRISGKPKDKSHDYGHGKYETLAMTIIGLALLIVAIGIVYGGVMKIVAWRNGQELEGKERLEQLQIRKEDVQLRIKKTVTARELFANMAPQAEFDDTLIPKLIERIDVVDKESIRVVFRGGLEVEGTVEK